MEIIANNLCFKTIEKTVVSGASFTCQMEQNAALYGPEGSGKKVLLLILGGFLKPSSGSVTFDGKNIFQNLGEYRKKIGLGEIEKINPLSENLTLRENLEFFMELHGIKKKQEEIQEILDQFKINIFADTPTKECPPLARSLASLACASIHNPEIIILDEPTKKLASLQVQEFWKIAHENLAGKTVIFSTKNFEEAKANAQKIITMDFSRTAEFGAPAPAFPAIEPAKNGDALFPENLNKNYE